MKSRTSFFHKTVFRKDVTRFAPLWGLYTACMILGVSMLYQANDSYRFQRELCSLPPAMNVVNFFYAAIAAQLLFGDLYSSRMCNALHALPLRRECWFCTHVAAGLSFSLVPTLIGMLLAALLDAASDSIVIVSWQLPWLNLLAMNLQYLFYFGLAVLCVMCAGSRFAQLVVYGIMNFAAVITYWLVDTLLTPLFYGLRTVQEPFMIFSPVVYGSTLDYIDMQYLRDADNNCISAWFTLEAGGWVYTAACAAIGVAFLVAALLLYRRRRLEAAGDFLALKCLEPVFTMVFPVVAGGTAYFFTNGILGISGVAYLIAGLVIGYIAGRMLLERSIRVFSKKNMLGFLALAAGCCAVFLIAKADPLGWEDWLPEAEEVAQVRVYPGYYNYYYENGSVCIDTPEGIRQVRRVHEIALEDRTVLERAWEQNNYSEKEAATTEMAVPNTVVAAKREGDYISPQDIMLEYYMKDGSVHTRNYVIDACGEAGEILIPYFSNMQMLFPDYLKLPDREKQTIADATLQVRIDDGWGVNHTIESKELIVQLLEAIEADCEAGRMAQNYDFRSYSNTSDTYWMSFDMGEYTASFSIYSDCTHTNEFLLSLGIEHRNMSEMTEKEH